MTEPARATVLDRLIAGLRGRAAPLDGQARPAAVLWTDPGREWEPLVDLLLARVEEALVLGDYRPERRTGPAVWLRCVVDGALDEPRLPDDRPPVVYLPGVARQDLRAGAECPDRLKPLVELLFRGALWHHPNGGDWTVNAFLASPKTLGLDVAGDRATAEALSRALAEVAATPVAQLAGRRLEADDFDRMLAGDVARDLLRWMGDPEGARGRLGANGWHAFCNRCREELGFDPAREADVAAGEKLAAGAGRWAAVWDRYAEAPANYGGVADLLRRSRPAGGLPLNRDRWPDLNQEDEQTVRAALDALPERSHAAACAEVAELERQHGERRTWVWARLGEAPLAALLRPLAALADAARRALGGTAPDDVAAAYLERGWQADLAAWEALAAAPVEAEACVKRAVRHLVEPWLDESARAFQAAVARTPLPGPEAQPTVTAADDGCLLFVDGLRFDLARRLAERLEGRGLRVDLGWRWAALPTVTGTGKPAVTPVADDVGGGAPGPAFGPRLKAGGRPVDAAGLRAALAERGYQMLGGGRGVDGDTRGAGEAVASAVRPVERRLQFSTRGESADGAARDAARPQGAGDGPHAEHRRRFSARGENADGIARSAARPPVAGDDPTKGADRDVGAPRAQTDRGWSETGEFDTLGHQRGAREEAGQDVGAADAPRARAARGWLETGEFDTLGHQRGAGLARDLDGELARVADRIARVLDAGWRSVRVVTDHGWLLLPGGLPKVDLPKHLTASRWARCAAPAGEAAPDVVRVPWHWDAAQWFATPPGAACFNRSEEYAHGGLSIQECLIPDMVVTRAESAAAGRIASVTWRGLRCFVEAEVRGGPVTADLRLGRPNGASAAAAAKPVDAEGAVSLVLADDEHETAALVLVLLDDARRVLAQRSIRAGEDA